jgi:hypothetical protein
MRSSAGLRRVQRFATFCACGPSRRRDPSGRGRHSRCRSVACGYGAVEVMPGMLCPDGDRERVGPAVLAGGVRRPRPGAPGRLGRGGGGGGGLVTRRCPVEVVVGASSPTATVRRRGPHRAAVLEQLAGPTLLGLKVHVRDDGGAACARVVRRGDSDRMIATVITGWGLIMGSMASSDGTSRQV